MQPFYASWAARQEVWTEKKNNVFGFPTAVGGTWIGDVLLSIEQETCPMGHNMFVFPERLVDGRYEAVPDLKVFDWRHYEMYAFLGSYPSEVHIPVLATERGIPEDSPMYEFLMQDGGFCDVFGMSWLSVRELLGYDYDIGFVGAFRPADGTSYWPDPAAATETTVRRFLGPDFFQELDRLAASGADRIVFFCA